MSRLGLILPPVTADTQAALDGKQNADSDLSVIAALDSTQSGVVASDGSGWVRKSYSALKTALALVKGDVDSATSTTRQTLRSQSRRRNRLLLI
jgi:hypothetical protein